MREWLMKALARVFPTQWMGEQAWLAALWRVFFYAIGPTQPFLFRTRDYAMYAVPQRWHLSRAVIRKGYWEKHVTERWRSYLGPGMTVVDVGANFGHFALTAANIVGLTGLVLAFEPQPDIYADLTRNAGLVSHGNIRSFALALGDTNHDAVIVVDTDSSGRSSLVGDLVPRPGASLTVPVRRLDDVLAEAAPARKVGLMKIDVEGFEAQVFRGARATLKRDLPVVFTEFSMNRILRAGEDPEAVLESLLSLGYEARLIDEKTGQLVVAKPPVADWATRYRPHLNNVETTDWFVNLVLEPVEKVGLRAGSE